MAETLVSPGVLQRENDRSFIAPAPVEVGAALIGPTVKGPVEIPTVVTSFGDYREKFGTTFLSGSDEFEFLTSISAQKYFSEGGTSLLVTRVTPGAFAKTESTRILANSGSVTGTTPTSSLAGFSLLTTGSGFGIRIINNTTNVIDTIITSGSSTADVTNLGLFSYTGQNLTALRDEINTNTSLNTRFSASLNASFDLLAISGASATTAINGFSVETGSLSQLVSAASGTLRNLGTIGGGIANTTGLNDDGNRVFTLKTLEVMNLKPKFRSDSLISIWGEKA